MISFLLVTGPPFDVPLWTSVTERIQSKNHTARVVSMLCNGDGTIDSESAQLAKNIFDCQTPVVLIAHGTAIPAALQASRKIAPEALILSNGPLQSHDPFTRALIQWSHLPHPLAEKILSPDRKLKLLASSIGLRRLVVNPYVMDHDTTVMVCGPIIEDKQRRYRMRNYLRSLKKVDWQTPKPHIPTLLLWGDSDPLTTRKTITFLKTNPINFAYEPIAGGRYLHPIERPWELADRAIHWAENSATTT